MGTPRRCAPTAGRHHPTGIAHPSRTQHARDDQRSPAACGRGIVGAGPATKRGTNRVCTPGAFRACIIGSVPSRSVCRRSGAGTEDIPRLVRYFAHRYATQLGKRIPSVPAPAMEVLQAYAWPGHVRELENVIERAVIHSQGPHLDLSSWLPTSGPRPPERGCPDPRGVRATAHAGGARGDWMAGQRRTGRGRATKHEADHLGSADEKLGIRRPSRVAIGGDAPGMVRRDAPHRG